MRLTRQLSAEDCRLQCSFESVRKTLLEKQDVDCLSRPLAFWALPTDRRLPIALLNRTVRELLQTSFEELSATPGIGHKKIHSLVELLQRATRESTPAKAHESSERVSGNGNKNGNGNGHGKRHAQFDAAAVSDAVWSCWCEAIEENGLADEPLGRLAPSLQQLPTVIWDTPLGYYVNYSLSEVRQLKTHGDKRVRSILHVFFEVHRIVSLLDAKHHLCVRPLPRFVLPMEAWIRKAKSARVVPTLEEAKRKLAEPLLDQLQVDAGAVVRELAEGRWAIHGERQSVRAQSRQMGVTRARIYQLFEDCQRIMHVRWPEGDQQLQDLLEAMRANAADDSVLTLIQSMHDLLFAIPRELEVARSEA